MPDVSITYVSPEDSWLKKLCINTIEVLAGRKKIERLYQELKDRPHEPGDLWGLSIRKLGVNLVYDQTKLEMIPKRGPLVVIANHPFGVLDGLALAAMIQSIRPKFLFPVNSVLCQDEELNQFLLPIDFAPTKAAMRQNIETKRIILDHLAQDGTLLIFPSGGVATARGYFGKIEDLEWKRFVAKVIQQSKATVVPMFFHGKNSWMFHAVSQFSQTLRLGMLLHELCNKMGKDLRIDIGDPILFEALSGYKDRQELLDYLKVVTFSLPAEE